MASSSSLGAVADVAASQHGAFTRGQAAHAQVSSDRISALVRRGLLEEPAPGLLLVCGSPRTFHQLSTAASLIVGGRGAVRHRAAGWWHRLDGIDAPPERVAVMVGQNHSVDVGSLAIDVSRSRAKIVSADVVEVDGVRVLGLARTIVDLAADGTAAQVERYIDDFERRKQSLRWLELTAQELRTKGRRGPALVLADLERRKQRGNRIVRGSWFQRLVKECLRSAAIPGLVEEYEVRDASGRVVARCDLAVPAVRLAIEAHSRRFHTGAEAEFRDDEREAAMVELGWVVRYVGGRRRPSSRGRFVSTSNASSPAGRLTSGCGSEGARAGQRRSHTLRTAASAGNGGRRGATGGGPVCPSWRPSGPSSTRVRPRARRDR